MVRANSFKPQRTQPVRFVHGYLGYLLGQTSHALYQEFEQHIRAAGLRSIEWRVLATLYDSPPLNISELADEVLAQQPTVTKLVRRMVNFGWLGLQADSHDQRRTMVAISGEGKRLVRPLISKAKRHEGRALSALTAAELVQLRLLLGKLHQHHA